jgi:hypothetical protein
MGTRYKQDPIGTIDGAEYFKCRNNECENITRGGLFCCIRCVAAHDGKYEIDRHSTGCDARQLTYRRILLGVK